MSSRQIREEILSKAAQRYAHEQSIPTSSALDVEQGYNKAAPKGVEIDLSFRKTKLNGNTVLTFSRRLNLNDLTSWNNAFWRCNNSREVTLDFANIIDRMSTFALMFVAHQVRGFQKKYPAIKLHAINHVHMTYAGHLGFFDYIGGGEFGKKVGEARGGVNYLPITVIDVDSFINDSGQGNVRDAIESESRKLARILLRTGSGFAFDTVQYSIREIIRNVFEHSNAKQVAYCAQYSPSINMVEVTIIDEGGGIYPALTFNPKYKHLNKRQAVHYALMPGVSGNYMELADYSPDYIWRNSGYGLYMASRLCRNLGAFLIISSDHAIQLYKGEKQITALRDFQGTLITLKMNIGNGVDFSADLKRYAAEGKEISQHILGAKVIEASAASQMLIKDFRSR